MFSMIKNQISGSKKIITRCDENGSLCVIPKDILVHELLPFLDLKALMKLRSASKELYDLVNLFLKNEVYAKRIGLIALSKGSKFYAIGESVAHRVISDSIWDAIFNDGFQDINITPLHISNSFSSKVTLFKSEKAAKEKIKSQTFFGENQKVYSKPYLAKVDLLEDVLFAKLDKDTIGYTTEAIPFEQIGKCSIQYIEDSEPSTSNINTSP
ncbi:TPA: hypothetical protein JA329_12995 [Legionella pneumophila]|nr:hypothetical protein [Legionella pneumophila]HAT8146424.1 hypothetical protein [Legionella pneumophila]